MGKGQSKLTRAQADELASETGIPKKEVEELHKAFYAEFPGGSMPKVTFDWIFRQFFPFGDPHKFSSRLFFVFDKDKSESISFDEFIYVNGLINGQNLKKKLQLVFKVYDLNNDGYITKDEMIEVVGYIYNMIGTMSDMPVDELTPEQLVNKIWSNWDVKEQQVTEERFVELSATVPGAVDVLIPGRMEAK